MATRVTGGKPVVEKGSFGGPGSPGPNGKGPRGNGWRGGEDPERRLSPAAYRITLWVVLAAIVMMFAAMSSAYIILSSGEQRRAVAMPRMFFFSTAIILTSSWTLETAKRSLKQVNLSRCLRWLWLTLFLGTIFLASQLFGWRELAAQGVYFASHPHSSFFYFFTGVHGVHLAGGIGALVYLLIRMRKKRLRSPEKTELAAQLVSIYWHTMDALWIWLFLLLLVWK